MKRFAALLAALMLCLSGVCALAEAEFTPVTNAAISIGSELRMLARNDEYISSLGFNMLEDTRERFTGSAAVPARIYVYDVDKYAYLAASGMDATAFTPTVQEFLANRAMQAIPALLNGSAGVMALAASSVFTWNQTILCDDPALCLIYVLEYEAYAAPVIIVAVPGEGYVNLTGTFLAMDDPLSALPTLISVEPEIIELT